MALIVGGVFVLVIWAYVLFLRERMEVWFAGTRYEWWHKQVEDRLWERSRTILVARGYQLAGWVLGLQTFLAANGIDTTPFTDELTNLVPDQYRKFLPLAFSLWLILTGMAMTKLRNMTDGPVGSSM